MGWRKAEKRNESLSDTFVHYPDLLQALRKLSGTKVLLDLPIKKNENVSMEKAVLSSNSFNRRTTELNSVFSCSFECISSRLGPGVLLWIQTLGGGGGKLLTWEISLLFLLLLNSEEAECQPDNCTRLNGLSSGAGKGLSLLQNKMIVMNRKQRACQGSKSVSKSMEMSLVN